KRDLDTARAELQQYGESKSIVAIDGGNETIAASRVEQVSAGLTTVQNERIAKQGAYDAIRRAAPESIAANDPLVSQLTSEASRLQREYNDRLATLRPEHPEMMRRREEIDNARRARANAVSAAYSKALEAARTDLNAAAAQEASMRSALTNQRSAAMSQQANAVRYNDLRTLVETKLALLTTLQKQLSETEVAARLRGSNSSNINWVDHAQLPTQRFNVTMNRNLQSAFPLGIVLGLAAIFFLEYMDRSVKTPEELERLTGLASLGVIPAAGTVKSTYGYGASGRGTANLRAVDPPTEPGQTPQGIDLLPHLDSRSPISESYRAFRTSLLLASANSPKVIVITSSFAREGKTTTSVNLATVLAQMGKPVLLVDADLRRPRLQKIFRGKMNLGLVNYLAANIPLEDVIQETSVPHLSVVLSGPTPPNPSELLASDRMKHLIHEMRGKFAYVIFDSPPVLAVTDAIVLAANADGVVLTVHGGQTPRELVIRSAERLRQSNIPVLGALLNNLDLHQYGYTYKKSYFDYYDSEAPPSTEAQRKTV
ncbi:MAG TPA: polysaccharide biosynthesis tyrosine autokinase, partial [Thermoanaerobaculia bacterium]